MRIFFFKFQIQDYNTSIASNGEELGKRLIEQSFFHLVGYLEIWRVVVWIMDRALSRI